MARSLTLSRWAVLAFLALFLFLVGFCLVVLAPLRPSPPRIDVHVYCHFEAHSIREIIMSVVSDKIAALTAAASAALTRSQSEVAGLQAQVASLQAQVTAEGTNAATAADLSALDAAVATVNAIDPTNPATTAAISSPPAAG